MEIRVSQQIQIRFEMGTTRACGASVYVCVTEGGRGEAQGREKRASRGWVRVWAGPGKAGERRPALKGAVRLWRVGR